METTFYIISIISILFIISYGRLIRKTKSPDVLERNFMDCNGCDGWAATHFALFAWFGYLFPDNHLHFLLISVIWELFETYVGTHKVMINGERFVLIGSSAANGNLTGNDEDFWYGRISDVAFNMSGYILGDFYKRSVRGEKFEE